MGQAGCPETSVINYQSTLRNISELYIALSLKIGQVGCPETSVINYQSTLRDVPREHRSNLGGAESPISTIASAR